MAAAAAASSSTQQDAPILSQQHHLSVVLLGGVDCGKTTLVQGSLNDGTTSVEEFKKSVAQRNSINAAALKCGFPGHSSGIRDNLTVEPKMYTFTPPPLPGSSLRTRRFTVIDAPGHADFLLKNLCRAVAAADMGILVVSARRGEFEVGMSRHGRTREHAMLAFTMGIKKLIVAVNKLDVVDSAGSAPPHDEERRYGEVVTEVQTHLKRTGFNIGKGILFVPISAWTGANIRSRTSSSRSSSGREEPADGEEEEKKQELPWYSGPCLVELMQQLSAQQIEAEISGDKSAGVVHRPRHRGVPLRISIFGSFKVSKSSADGRYVLFGKILSGRLHSGERLGIVSSKILSVLVCSAERIQCSGVDVPLASAGDVVGIRITVTNRSFIENQQQNFKTKMGMYELKKKTKHVLSTAAPRQLLPTPLCGVAGSIYDSSPPVPARKFFVQMILMNHPGRLHDGFTPVVSCGSSYSACRMRLLAKLDRRTGRVLSSFLPAGESVALKHIVGDVSSAPVVTSKSQVFIRNNDAAFVEFTPFEPCFCVESFSGSAPKLGRLSIFDLGRLIAVAVVKSVTTPGISLFKWEARKTALLIRFKSRNRFGEEAFAVWNIMTTTALFLA